MLGEDALDEITDAAEEAAKKYAGGGKVHVVVVVFSEGEEKEAIEVASANAIDQRLPWILREAADMVARDNETNGAIIQ